jgi:hypothetical protein
VATTGDFNLAIDTREGSRCAVEGRFARPPGGARREIWSWSPLMQQCRSPQAGTGSGESRRALVDRHAGPSALHPMSFARPDMGMLNATKPPERVTVR